ncbi:hypothetical protein BDZ97DRAFT_1758329 [Flammula alnicola]|nr:hypothetical protein BDZ97DRAFT_1758329 [Flammula alnicola]
MGTRTAKRKKGCSAHPVRNCHGYAHYQKREEKAGTPGAHPTKSDAVGTGAAKRGMSMERLRNAQRTLNAQDARYARYGTHGTQPKLCHGYTHYQKKEGMPGTPGHWQKRNASGTLQECQWNAMADALLKEERPVHDAILKEERPVHDAMPRVPTRQQERQRPQRRTPTECLRNMSGTPKGIKERLGNVLMQ